MIEGVGGIVSEGIDGGVGVLVSKFSRNEFEVVLESKIFGLFADDLL